MSNESRTALQLQALADEYVAFNHPAADRVILHNFVGWLAARGVTVTEPPPGWESWPIAEVEALITSGRPDPRAGPLPEPVAPDAAAILALHSVLGDGGNDDGCFYCGGEWRGGDNAEPVPHILHESECPIVRHRMRLIEQIVDRDPPRDSLDGKRLDELVTAQERYEKAKYPLGSLGDTEDTPPTDAEIQPVFDRLNDEWRDDGGKMWMDWAQVVIPNDGRESPLAHIVRGIARHFAVRGGAVDGRGAPQ